MTTKILSEEELNLMLYYKQGFLSLAECANIAQAYRLYLEN